MRKSWVVALGVIVASSFIFGSVVSAMGKKPPVTLKASGKVTATKVKDVANMTMTIKTDQGKELVFQLGRKTSVRKGNKPAIMSMDIKVGNQVKVEYEAKGKKNNAKLVTVETPQASKPAAKPSATSTKTPTKKARR
jgi:hypothetical protein